MVKPSIGGKGGRGLIEDEFLKDIYPVECFHYVSKIYANYRKLPCCDNGAVCV